MKWLAAWIPADRGRSFPLTQGGNDASEHFYLVVF